MLVPSLIICPTKPWSRKLKLQGTLSIGIFVARLSGPGLAVAGIDGPETPEFEDAWFGIWIPEVDTIGWSTVDLVGIRWTGVGAVDVCGIETWSVGICGADIFTMGVCGVELCGVGCCLEAMCFFHFGAIAMATRWVIPERTTDRSKRSSKISK